MFVPQLGASLLEQGERVAQAAFGGASYHHRARRLRGQIFFRAD